MSEARKLGILPLAYRKAGSACHITSSLSTLARVIEMSSPSKARLTRRRDQPGARHLNEAWLPMGVPLGAC